MEPDDTDPEADDRPPENVYQALGPGTVETPDGQILDLSRRMEPPGNGRDVEVTLLPGEDEPA